jgi:hypothetical protein
VAGLSFESSVVELDPVERATGWGADLVAIPRRREAWFSRYERTVTARLYRFDIETRRVQRIKGLAGELRGATLAADGRRIWLLATFGLQELDVGTMNITRTLRTGVGKYLQHLHALDSDHLGLARMGGRSLAVMQVSRWAVVRRLNIAAPDLIRREADRFIAYSFYSGSVTVLDPTLKRTGTVQPIPLCLSPVVNRDQIFALAADKRPVGRDISIDRSYNLVPRQELRVFEVTSGRQLDRIPLEISIDWIHGIDGAGRLVLSHDRQLILFDPQRRQFIRSYHIEPRHPIEANFPRPSPHLFKLYAVSLAGPFEAVIIPDEHIQEIWHVRWADEADAR